MYIHCSWDHSTLVKLLFFTPIWSVPYSGDIKDLNLIQDEITSILPKYKDNLSYTWGDAVLTSVSQTKNILDDTPLLKEHIITNINLFMDEFNHSKFNTNFIKSWVNYTRNGGYQNYHHHLGEPDISGVYYYQTTGYDGDIMFKTDSGGLNHSKIFGNNNIIRIKPNIGQLILFPAFLEHAVALNTTNTERISISFNCTLNPFDDIIIS